MITMDVFNQNAFRAVTMTAAIQDLKFVPGFLGGLGLFTPFPVRTRSVMIERRGSTLHLIPTTERGAPRSRRAVDRRAVRNFNTVRLAESQMLQADELQGIRAFGSETELEAVQTEIMRRQQILGDDLELTLEYHRLSAINGVLLDSDGSTIYDYFAEFGVSAPSELAFNWSARTAVKTYIANNVTRPIIRALGGRATPGMRIIALCGDDFFDAMQENAEYRATYLQTAAVQELRQGNAFEKITAWGVDWYNYRGTDDNSTVAIGATKCKFIPLGVPNVFQVAYSPAEGLDFVNTLGLPKYTNLVPDPTARKEYVDIDVASYPLHICTTPEALLTGRSGS